MRNIFKQTTLSDSLTYLSGSIIVFRVVAFVMKPHALENKHDYTLEQLRPDDAVTYKIGRNGIQMCDAR